MTFHARPAEQFASIKAVLFHPAGPWGSRHPMRYSAIVYFLVREPVTGGTPGREHLLSWMPIGDYGQVSLTGDLSTVPATATTIEEFIRFKYRPTGEIEERNLENIIWRSSADLEQDVGDFITKWPPPERTLAEVNGRRFYSIPTFAKALYSLLADAQAA